MPTNTPPPSPPFPSPPTHLILPQPGSLNYMDELLAIVQRGLNAHAYQPGEGSTRRRSESRARQGGNVSERERDRRGWNEQVLSGKKGTQESRSKRDRHDPLLHHRAHPQPQDLKSHSQSSHDHIDTCNSDSDDDGGDNGGAIGPEQSINLTYDRSIFASIFLCLIAGERNLIVDVDCGSIGSDSESDSESESDSDLELELGLEGEFEGFEGRPQARLDFGASGDYTAGYIETNGSSSGGRLRRTDYGYDPEHEHKHERKPAQGLQQGMQQELDLDRQIKQDELNKKRREKRRRRRKRGREVDEILGRVGGMVEFITTKIFSLPTKSIRISSKESLQEFLPSILLDQEEESYANGYGGEDGNEDEDGDEREDAGAGREGGRGDSIMKAGGGREGKRRREVVDKGRGGKTRGGDSALGAPHNQPAQSPGGPRTGRNNGHGNDDPHNNGRGHQQPQQQHDVLHNLETKPGAESAPDEKTAGGRPGGELDLKGYTIDELRSIGQNARTSRGVEEHGLSGIRREHTHDLGGPAENEPRPDGELRPGAHAHFELPEGSVLHRSRRSASRRGSGSGSGSVTPTSASHAQKHGTGNDHIYHHNHDSHKSHKNSGDRPISALTTKPIFPPLPTSTPKPETHSHSHSQSPHSTSNRNGSLADFDAEPVTDGHGQDASQPRHLVKESDRSQSFASSVNSFATAMEQEYGDDDSDEEHVSRKAGTGNHMPHDPIQDRKEGAEVVRTEHHSSRVQNQIDRETFNNLLQDFDAADISSGGSDSRSGSVGRSSISRSTVSLEAFGGGSGSGGDGIIAVEKQRRKKIVPNCLVIRNLERSRPGVRYGLLEVLQGRKIKVDFRDLEEGLHPSRGADMKEYAQKKPHSSTSADPATTQAALHVSKSLPDGFFVVYVVRKGNQENKTVPRWLIDKFALGCKAGRGAARGRGEYADWEGRRDRLGTMPERPFIDGEYIRTLRRLSEKTHMHPPLRTRIADLITYTMHHPNLVSNLSSSSISDIKTFIRISRILFRPFHWRPELLDLDVRGREYDQRKKLQAAMEREEWYAIEEDVRSIWHNVIRHRIWLRTGREEVLFTVHDSACSWAKDGKGIGRIDGAKEYTAINRVIEDILEVL